MGKYPKGLWGDDAVLERAPVLGGFGGERAGLLRVRLLAQRTKPFENEKKINDPAI